MFVVLFAGCSFINHWCSWSESLKYETGGLIINATVGLNFFHTVSNSVHSVLLFIKLVLLN